MANFNEHSLEMSIMDLFQDEGYIYLNGEQIHRSEERRVGKECRSRWSPYH